MYFSNEAKIQQGSRLIQLPAEIKLMILRLLLVHDGPLRARNWYGEKPHPKVPKEARQFARRLREADEEVAVSYNLSPEILATCQTLYHEGYPLLYKNNTLGIQICEGREYNARRDRQCGCGTLNCEGGVFVYAIPYVCAEPDQPHYKATSTIGRLLQKFDKLHIDINDEGYSTVVLRKCLSYIQEVAWFKRVQVKYIGDLDLEHSSNKKAVLPHLTLIRCNELIVLNPEFLASEVSRITAIVTGHSQVVDLEKLYQNFRAYCYGICSRCNSTMHTGGLDPQTRIRYSDYHCLKNSRWDWEQLYAAVEASNAKAFFTLHGEMMEYLDEERWRADEDDKDNRKSLLDELRLYAGGQFR